MQQKILNKGTSVWVHVTRDRERGGKIVDVDHTAEFDRTLYGVKIFGSDQIRYYPINKIRPIAIQEIDENDLKKPETATDPEVIRTPETGGTKNDHGKTRLELIPASGIEGIGRAMTFGANKYSAHNWRKGFKWLRLCGSAMRHLTAWMGGEDKDPESGLSHLDHLGACVVMLIAHEQEGLGQDDRITNGIPAQGGVGGVQ